MTHSQKFPDKTTTQSSCVLSVFWPPRDTRAGTILSAADTIRIRYGPCRYNTYSMRYTCTRRNVAKSRISTTKLMFWVDLYVVHLTNTSAKATSFPAFVGATDIISSVLSIRQLYGYFINIHCNICHRLCKSRVLIGMITRHSSLVKVFIRASSIHSRVIKHVVRLDRPLGVKGFICADVRSALAVYHKLDAVVDEHVLVLQKWLWKQII